LLQKRAYVSVGDILQYGNTRFPEKAIVLKFGNRRKFPAILFHYPFQLPCCEEQMGKAVEETHPTGV